MLSLPTLCFVAPALFKSTNNMSFKVHTSLDRKELTRWTKNLNLSSTMLVLSLCRQFFFSLFGNMLYKIKLPRHGFPHRSSSRSNSSHPSLSLSKNVSSSLSRTILIQLPFHKRCYSSWILNPERSSPKQSRCSSSIHVETFPWPAPFPSPYSSNLVRCRWY